MKAQLIITENPIIVTDGIVNKGDLYYKQDLDGVFCAEYGLDRKSPKLIACNYNYPSPIKLKPIDYNGIDFGIVDVEKLAMDKLKSKWAHLYTFGYPQKPYPTNYESDLNLIKVGIYESQQLNEKMFTFGEMYMAFEAGMDKQWDIEWGEGKCKPDFETFIEKLSLPKTFEVEIEETPTNIKIIKKL